MSFCPPSFHYGVTAFSAFRALRLVCAAGLPSRKKKGSSTVCATPELELAKIRRRNTRLQMRWERGAISPPRDPHEPNVGLVIFYCVFDDWSRVCFASVIKRPCGVRTSHHVVYRGFPRISAIQRRCTARTCRIRSARLRVALKPPRRRLLRRRRDSSTLPALGR